MSWVEEALDRLEATQHADGGWSYGNAESASASTTEPTALAAMALAAHDRAAETAINWLTQAQRPDGGFAANPAHDESDWATSVGCIALLAGGRGEAGEAGITWLVSQSAYTLPVVFNSPYGYDTSLVAWTWTPNDYSWVEPTALALLAVRQSSRAADPRVAQGEQFLLDRVAFDGSQGGWNYGEPRVFGANLSPAVAPTALAMLALRGTAADLTTAEAFLQSRRDSLTSLFSLAWASNAISAMDRLDAAWQAALARTWTDAAASPTRETGRNAVSTALALLAVADRARNPLILG